MTIRLIQFGLLTFKKEEIALGAVGSKKTEGMKKKDEIGYVVEK